MTVTPLRREQRLYMIWDVSPDSSDKLIHPLPATFAVRSTSSYVNRVCGWRDALKVHLNISQQPLSKNTPSRLPVV